MAETSTASSPTTSTAPPPSTSAANTPTPTKTTNAPQTKKRPTPDARSATISAFGDSVLLGAAPALRSAVRGMSLDAVVGRQAWDTLDDVAAAHRAGKLAPIVVIHTGSNGIISPDQLADTLAALTDRAEVILINDHVDRSWQRPNNKTIAAAGTKFHNVTVVDWDKAASANPKWLGPDGIHVNATGADGYATLVAAAIG